MLSHHLVSDSRQSVHQLLQPFVSPPHLQEHQDTNPDDSELIPTDPCCPRHQCGGVYLQKYAEHSQAVFFCHSLLKQTVPVGVPVDQMELKRDETARLTLDALTQILTFAVVIRKASQDQCQKANVVAAYKMMIHLAPFFK